MIFFSIVVPTYNEEEDIERTLKSLLSLDYPNKEIVIVDDSKDRTPEIVGKYIDQGVVLIKREKNIGGRCGARNEGILKAKGEVVVILNADVSLPRDFLNLIAVHYEAGADYVLVEARVSNTEHLFARFVDAQHLVEGQGDAYSKNEWTEGYSCRKEVAIKAGLFPVLPITIKAGEDGYFGNQIKKLGFKKVVDLSICVSHVAPYKFGDFWRIRKERISSVASFFLDQKSVFQIFIRVVYRFFSLILKTFIIFPWLVYGFLLSKFSLRGKKDWLGLAWAGFIQESAFFIGQLQTFIVLLIYLVSRKKVV